MITVKNQVSTYSFLHIRKVCTIIMTTMAMIKQKSIIFKQNITSKTKKNITENFKQKSIIEFIDSTGLNYINA